METLVGVVAELLRESCRIWSVPERRPLIVLPGPSLGSHERVKPTEVDELEASDIDDHVRRVSRLLIKLTVKQNRGGSIERAAQPDDQHVRQALGADGEPWPLRFSGWPPLVAAGHDFCMRLIHDCSTCRSVP